MNLRKIVLHSAFNAERINGFCRCVPTGTQIELYKMTAFLRRHFVPEMDSSMVKFYMFYCFRTNLHSTFFGLDKFDVFV